MFSIIEGNVVITDESGNQAIISKNGQLFIDSLTLNDKLDEINTSLKILVKHLEEINENKITSEDIKN